MTDSSFEKCRTDFKFS